MTKTFRLTTLNEALDVATTLTCSWFRGHSRTIGNLTPRLFRPENRDPTIRDFRPDLELSTIEAFKRHAPLLAEWRLPPDNDRLGWLCVMQHFRAPTRLLDWTENLLVALYFAVCDDNSHDAELWAMLPWQLNKASIAQYALPLANARHPRFFLEQPYWHGTDETRATKLRLTALITAPIALAPPMLFPRMAVQSGTFTIHPLPEGAKTIIAVLPDPRHLVRYVVPAGCKGVLREQLRVLGFSDRHLFPDLEGLSRTVVFDNRVIGYSPPDPPFCSGLHSFQTDAPQ
jgi:hypothetical protein